MTDFTEFRLFTRSSFLNDSRLAPYGFWKEKWTPMKLEFRHNRDFWAGLLFFLIGAAAVFVARDYPFGRLLRMGSGFFPTLLGVILMLFGIYIVLKGLRRNEKIQGNWSVRALIVLPVMIVLFGVLMERGGFIPALAFLAFGSAAASKGFHWGEVLLLTAILTVLSLAVFIWGLGLPYPLIKGF
jgi:hypothetical protein